MSGEISHLASLLRAYHTALLSASSISANAAVDALLPLHSTDAIVVFPNFPAPASTLDAMSVQYAFHLSLPNAYKGACFPLPPSSSSSSSSSSLAPEAGAGTGVAAGAGVGEKGKAKAKSAATGKGRKKIETEASASTGAGTRSATESAIVTASGESEGGQQMIELEVQEIVPMAPDWAFARCEFRQSPTIAAAVTAAAEAGALEIPEAAAGMKTGRDSGDGDGGKKVWGMFILRKLSLGVNEKMGGWRIARSVLIPLFSFAYL